LLPNILDNVPTKPFTESYRKVRDRECCRQTNGRTRFDNVSAGIRLYVIHKLLNLLLNPGLGLQNLTAFDVQEAEGVDITKSVEELRLRKGIFGVVLGLLERDASLQ
jgi:hypothetical protein